VPGPVDVGMFHYTVISTEGIGLLFVSRIQWRCEDFCSLEQRFVVPPLQPAMPILSVLNN